MEMEKSILLSIWTTIYSYNGKRISRMTGNDRDK